MQRMEAKKILLVEDEQRIADTLRMGLAENGYRIEIAYDGKLGYKLFQSQPSTLLCSTSISRA
jgi:DNA-binding response OmpR family regulator